MKGGTSSEAESDEAIESHLPVYVPIISLLPSCFGVKGQIEWRGKPTQVHN